MGSIEHGMNQRIVARASHSTLQILKKVVFLVDNALKDVDGPALHVQDLGFHKSVLVEAVQ